MFLPNAAEHARAKVAICARYGIEGCPPVSEDEGMRPWREIFDHCLATMERTDLVIANLTPFRGASADSGTLVELGWFLGRGRPAFGYSNAATPFAERCKALLAVQPDPAPGLAIEAFGLSDNLMVPGALLASGGQAIALPSDARDRPFDALDIFEQCVAVAAGVLRSR